MLSLLPDERSTGLDRQQRLAARQLSGPAGDGGWPFPRGNAIDRKAARVCVAGKIELNSEGDEKEFKEKRGINAKYALESSPLMRMCMKSKDQVTTR